MINPASYKGKNDANIVHIIVCVLLVAALAYIGNQALVKSDCNYARETIEIIDGNKDKFSSARAYEQARSSHEYFIMMECSDANS